MHVTRLLKFVGMILRKGKFYPSGPNYPELRRKALKGLERFSPTPVRKSSLKAGILRNRFLWFWAGQASFIKNGLKLRGGHLCNPETGLCYIRIPKVASTALCSAMLRGRFRDLEQHTMTPQKINFLTDVNLQTTVHPKEQQTFFTVVRNPLARIVSFYRDAFEHETGDFIYEDYLFGIFRKDMSFSTFVRTLHLVPDRLKDQHVKPQYVHLEWYRRYGVSVRIFKLEEIREVRNFLSREGLDLEHINKSIAHYDYRAYYDRETLDIAYRIYHHDIAAYAYSEEYEGLCRFVAGR